MLFDLTMKRTPREAQPANDVRTFGMTNWAGGVFHQPPASGAVGGPSPVDAIGVRQQHGSNCRS